jgi:hypothetical protein
MTTRRPSVRETLVLITGVCHLSSLLLTHTACLHIQCLLYLTYTHTLSLSLSLSLSLTGKNSANNRRCCVGATVRDLWVRFVNWFGSSFLLFTTTLYQHSTVPGLDLSGKVSIPELIFTLGLAKLDVDWHRGCVFAWRQRRF